MRTLKILGFLLNYPTQMHIDALPECREFLRQEDWISQKNIVDLDALMDVMEKAKLLDLQEDYVDLFDRTPSLSLHLFEHVHGDSRDRGQALVDLSGMYEEAGLVIATDELPDYLPLFMEFLSVLSPEDASEHLGSAVNVIAAIGVRLRKRKSPYAAVFDAMIEAASRKPDMKAVEAALEKSSGKARNFKEIDKEWEEQFAFDNTAQNVGQAGSCPKADEMLARMEGQVNREGIEK